MKPWKAPGPDGFPAAFYQNSWDIVGKNMCDYVQRIWRKPDGIAKVNQTNICLIPKVDHPKIVMQFRLISLCNAIYKVVNKVIMGRYKNHMDRLTSLFQTGFVQGKVIHENIIIAK